MNNSVREAILTCLLKFYAIGKHIKLYSNSIFLNFDTSSSSMSEVKAKELLLSWKLLLSHNNNFHVIIVSFNEII